VRARQRQSAYAPLHAGRRGGARDGRASERAGPHRSSQAGTDSAVLLKLIVRLVECRLDPADLQIRWVHEGRYDKKLTPAIPALADLIRQRPEQAAVTYLAAA
jgi:hypothetical protein